MMNDQLFSFRVGKIFAERTLLICGGLSLLIYGYLAVSSQYYADATLTQLLTSSFVCAALCFFVWYVHHLAQCEVSMLWLLLFAVLFRLVGVYAFPILEDDMYRYLWDGYMTITTGSPYQQAPAQFFNSENLSPQFEDILGLINYPEIATIYGPVCQWIFALAYLIAPAEIWPLQVLFALADMGVIVLLLKLARPTMVLLYAWSPLVIKEFAFTAHPDVLGVFFLMLAVLCFSRKRFVGVGICMACAMGVKIFALLLLPFLMGLNWRAWLAFSITMVLVALPFGLIDAWLPEGLRAMGNDWLFNAPLYLLLAAWLSMDSIKAGLLIVLAIGVGGYWFYWVKHWPNSVPRGDYLFAAFFLCLPAFNPWYLVWLLPFAVLKPTLWAWCASVSVLLAYASGINLHDQTLQAYEIPNWVLLIEFGVIAVAAYVQCWIVHRPNTSAD